MMGRICSRSKVERVGIKPSQYYVYMQSGGHDANGQSKNSLSLQLSLHISALHLVNVSHRDENSREREIHRRYVKRSSGSFAAIVSAIRRSVVVPLISL